MRQVKTKIAIIAGARPNFMKVAPLCWELKSRRLPYFLLNVGQHFDNEMAGDFLREFNIKPDYNLQPAHSSVTQQMADIMSGVARVFTREHPSLVVVVGDTNSTLASAVAANKMNIPLAHIEAGLRSFNYQMPEEFNRKITDHLSQHLFAPSADAVVNLKREGIVENVHLVGNIMIDVLAHFLPQVKNTKEEFYFCTLHRAENVDQRQVLVNILEALAVLARDAKIYLPLHPRTRKMAATFGLMKRFKQIFSLLPPLGYKESLFYQKNARLVLTDSGGVQEETSYLGTPCITLRTETERPITVTHGTNTIGGITKKSIIAGYKKKSLKKKKTRILLWDGQTAQRIVNIIDH